MGWLRRHPPAHSNGHAPKMLPEWKGLSFPPLPPLIPPLTLIPQPVPVPIFRRSDRHADDNYAPPSIGRREVELKARHVHASNGRPQRIHDHPAGHLCSAMCSILDDPQEVTP